MDFFIGTKPHTRTVPNCKVEVRHWKVFPWTWATVSETGKGRPGCGKPCKCVKIMVSSGRRRPVSFLSTENKLSSCAHPWPCQYSSMEALYLRDTARLKAGFIDRETRHAHGTMKRRVLKKNSANARGRAIVLTTGQCFMPTVPVYPRALLAVMCRMIKVKRGGLSTSLEVSRIRHGPVSCWRCTRTFTC
jgi:hypothetical protein